MIKERKQSSIMMTMTVQERLQQLKKHWKRQQKQIPPEERFRQNSSDQFQFFLKGRQQKCKISGAYDNVSRTVAAAREATEKAAETDCSRRTVSPKMIQSIPNFF